MLLCRRVIIVLSLYIKIRLVLRFFFSFFPYTVSWVATSRYCTLSCKILLLKILYNQNNQRNDVNLLNPSIMS